MRKNNSKKALPYWAAGLSVLLFIVIGVWGVTHRAAKVDERGCQAEIVGKTVFVIDQSDAMSAQTRAEILSRVTNTIEQKVRTGELVSVFSITELSKKNLTPLFSYCKPQKEAHGPSESQRHIAANYSKNFAAPLIAAVGSPVTGSSQSPIAQALIDLTLSDYLSHPSASRLVIFSDLMEYTDKFRLYKCHDAKSAIAAFRASRGAAIARPRFTNTDVQLHIIPRAEIAPPVGQCRDAFWSWFFTDNEGKAAGFEQSYLPG